jgi:glycosyltransferase involved in cell wall biosynthesis
MADALPLGVVVIGRNEGQRLVACLDALRHLGVPVVYVDSGSTDGSAERAAERVGSVVVLDPGRPFSAARARNEGFARLDGTHAGLSAVQFIDGDLRAGGRLARRRMAMPGRQRA